MKKDDTTPEFYDPMEFPPERPYYAIRHHSPSPALEQLHYHNFFEIGYCDEGSGIFNIDGTVVPFASPCCSVLYAGQVHIAQSNVLVPSKWEFLYLDVNALLSHIDGYCLKELAGLSSADYTFPGILPQALYPDINALVRMTVAEASEGRPRNVEAMRGLVWALLVKHGRTAVLRTDAPGRGIRLVEEIGQAVNYINSKYAAPITVREIAEVCSMSEATLNRKFMAFTGYSPLQYIHNVRLNRAAALLLTGKSSVTEIAFSVGYSSLSSFNRQFLSRFGAPPTEWLKRNRTSGSF